MRGEAGCTGKCPTCGNRGTVATTCGHTKSSTHYYCEHGTSYTTNYHT